MTNEIWTAIGTCVALVIATGAFIGVWIAAEDPPQQEQSDERSEKRRY